MLQAFETLTPRLPTLLIGTDCPALRPEHLSDSLGALHVDIDAVFIPAEDGGYVLVGMKRPHPELFSGISWGTSEVMSQTRLHASQSKLRIAEPTTRSWGPRQSRRLPARVVARTDLGPSAEHAAGNCVEFCKQIWIAKLGRRDDREFKRQVGTDRTGLVLGGKIACEARDKPRGIGGVLLHHAQDRGDAHGAGVSCDEL